MGDQQGRLGRINLGELGGIEAGVRQLIRRTPLEVTEYTLPSGARLRVPTIEEALRVRRSWPCGGTRRGTTSTSPHSRRPWVRTTPRKFWRGWTPATRISEAAVRGVASQVARQLSEPQPADRTVTKELSSDKNLAPSWHRWPDVVRACQRLADLMVRRQA
jgi:hypothetical protein